MGKQRNCVVRGTLVVGIRPEGIAEGVPKEKGADDTAKAGFLSRYETTAVPLVAATNAFTSAAGTRGESKLDSPREIEVHREAHRLVNRNPRRWQSRQVKSKVQISQLAFL